MTLRDEIARTDSFDAMLIRLLNQPEIQAIATRWQSMRAEAGMQPIRPFDGMDASAEAAFFLIEVMVRIEKLRSELAVVVREGEGSPMDVSILMAQNMVRQADIISKRLAETLVEMHVSVHGVGMAVGGGRS